MKGEQALKVLNVLKNATSRSRIIPAAIVTVILFFMSVLSLEQFIDLSSDFGVLLYILCIVCQIAQEGHVFAICTILQVSNYD